MTICLFFFFFNDTATTEIYTLSLHDALPISTIHLNRVAFTIVGVTPVDYLGTLSTVPVLWAPVAARPLVGDGTRESLENRKVAAGVVYGHLKAGGSLPDAEAEMNGLAGQLRV